MIKKYSVSLISIFIFLYMSTQASDLPPKERQYNTYNAEYRYSNIDRSDVIVQINSFKGLDLVEITVDGESTIVNEFFQSMRIEKVSKPEVYFRDMAGSSVIKVYFEFGDFLHCQDSYCDGDYYKKMIMYERIDGLVNVSLIK